MDALDLVCTVDMVYNVDNMVNVMVASKYLVYMLEQRTKCALNIDWPQVALIGPDCP